MDDLLVKVSGSSNPQATASVIARSIDAGNRPEVRAIGASSVNQAVKACAIAGGFLAPKGIHVAFTLGFSDVVGDNGTTISAITLRPYKISG